MVENICYLIIISIMDMPPTEASESRETQRVLFAKALADQLMRTHSGIELSLNPAMLQIIGRYAIANPTKNELKQVAVLVHQIYRRSDDDIVFDDVDPFCVELYEQVLERHYFPDEL